MAAPYNLDGKVVFITGAARGIGLGTAKAVHRRGASVVLMDLDREAIERAATEVGERALGLAGDVTDTASLDAAVAAAVERFGGIDVAIANAGIAPQARTMRVYEPELFEKVLDVNLVGVWRTARACLPHVIERRGHILMISSIYAFINGIFVTPYAASKAGVEQLGRALRVELARHGTTAGVAYFGYVKTEMTRVGIEEDPLAANFGDVAPRFLRKQITADEAGEALARSVERRAARVTAPRRWAVLSALRGLFSPGLDARMARDEQLQAMIAEADVQGRLEAKVG
ncbi:MAG TPA: short-chain dehydrogenase/reductase [Thermoleophilaceae bacterium]|nr:short-chain dehydrogenase/reductase [Thermoleophilaceae bacterium]